MRHQTKIESLSESVKLLDDKSIQTFGDVQTVGFPKPATTVSPFVSSPLPTSDGPNLLEVVFNSTL